MSSTNQIGKIAQGLMDYEFDYIPEADKAYELLIASGTISGKLGELNILINQNFNYTGSDGNPSPRLQQEEIAILEQLYLEEYNSKQAKKVLRGIYQDGTQGGEGGSSDWIEIREGDTTIRRSATSSTSSATTRLNLSRDYKALAQEASDKIKELVYAYNMYGASPRQTMFVEECHTDNQDYGVKMNALEKIIKEAKEAANQDYLTISIIDTHDNILDLSPESIATIAYATDTNDFYVWDGQYWYAYPNTVLHFKPEIRDTQENILLRNQDAPATLAYGTDTNDLYIWDGEHWYIYENK